MLIACNCLLYWLSLPETAGPPMATAPYFYGSILLRALKSKIIVLLTNVYNR
jgi:hypothetical protein